MSTTLPVESQSGTTTTTHLSMAITPNPVGVDQAAVINIFCFPLPPVTDEVYKNIELQITLPDGTTASMSGINTQSEGTATIYYTPTQVGTYAFTVKSPNQTFSNGAVFSSSQYNTTLTVQEKQIQSYPDTPLPTAYWTHPINGQNRLWASISGDWLMRAYNATYTVWDSAGGFNPYSEAPLSSHIMWTKPLTAGGIVGGTSSDVTYYSGLSYQEYLTPPIVMNGRLYYNTHYGGIAPSTSTGYICVDLRTGEQIYENKQYTLSYGMEYNLDSGNQAGVVGPYLWALSTEPSGTTTWNLLDAFTGDLVLRFVNGTTGTAIVGPNGELDVYVLNTWGGTLSMWNSTQAFIAAGTIAHDLGSLHDWLPRAGNYSWNDGIQWTQTIPVTIAQNYFGMGPIFVFGAAGNTLLAGPIIGNSTYQMEVGYSLTTGEQLWKNEHDIYLPQRVSGEGIYADFNPAIKSWIAYNADTGKKLWTSEPYPNPWASYLGTAEGGTIAYGMLYAGTYGGMYAINITTGKIAWSFASENSGLETPYGSYPFFYGAEVADGVVFVAAGEHSPTQPLHRGENVYAIDAYTGELLWKVNGYLPMQAIANGFLMGYSAYDNQIYTFGRGPSRTTVTAPSVGITTSTPMTITGTVTDISAGSQQQAVAANFPNGLPAVSDESMSDFMEAVYMQQPMPSNTSGIPVTINVLDSNGNYRTIGVTTSDSTGTYGLTWTPDIPGNFTVIATFAGSNAYYGSSAQTYFYASPTATTAPTATPQSNLATTPELMTYVLIAAIAIIIAIAVVGVALAMMIKKRA